MTVDAESGGVRLYVSAPITPGDTVEEGRGYRLTLTYTVDDGLGPRIVAQEQVGIGFDDADLPISTPMTPEQLAAEQGSVCYEDGVAYTEPSPDAPGCFMNMRFPMQVVHSDGQGEASATVVDGQVIALVAQALVVQGLLAVIGIVSGVVLVVLARRLDAGLRVGQWRALHAVGWGSRRIWSARAVELLTVGVPAIALAALIGWFAAPLTRVDDAAPIASIAGIAAGVALALLLALQRTDRTTPGTARSRTVGTEATASTKGRP